MRGVGLLRGRRSLIPSPGACAPTSPPGRGSRAGLEGESGGLVSRRLAAVTVRFAPGGHPARSCSLSRGERVGVSGVELSWIRRSLIPSPDACAPTSPPGRGSWAGLEGESGGLVSRRLAAVTVRFAPGAQPARCHSLSRGERVGVRGVGLSRGRRSLIPSPDACAPTSPPGRGFWAGFAGESGRLVLRRPAAVTVRFAPGAQPARCHSLSHGERGGVRGVKLSWIRRSLIPSPDACAPTSPPGRGSWAGFAGESGRLVSRRLVVLTVRCAPGGHPARSCSLSHGERVGVRGVELSWIRRSLISSPGQLARLLPMGKVFGGCRPCDECGGRA